MGYNPETGMYTPDKPATPKLSGVGQYQTVDPTFVRNAFAEADAIKSLGLTKADIEARGGVSASGYYGDSWSATNNLTDAEYRAAIAGKTGVDQGKAINAATQAKRQKSLAESGTAYLAPNGIYYTNELEARQAGALGGAGGSSGAGAAGGASLESQGAARSAYALLLSEFSRYGLEALVTPLQDLIKQGLSGPEFQIALRNTDAYQKRFAGNTDRIKKGLTALSPAEYLALEDGYQSLMRNYGLPASYYAKDSLGTQAGFNKLIANDVSAVELEDRIVTAQKRVLDAAPEVMTALKRFYPDINNGEILAYTLDPEKGLTDIKRKITAAEIGGAALAAGLDTSLTDAEYLRRYGVTAETARAGYGAIGGGLERGRQLASIYQQPDYTQAIAEEEVFNLPGQTESQQKRKKIIGLEKAEFGGQTGVSSGALSQNRAGSY
jgi:hypothetical protein